MEIFYDTWLRCPQGRKPGKYLRKLAPASYGEDYSPLVESLPLEVVLIDSFQTIAKALQECRSCQSDRHEKRQLFANTWMNVQGVQILGLWDGEKFQARCLVNPSWQTFAPCYGAKHYQLEARLRYAGYSPGPVAKTNDVLAAMHTKIIRPDFTGLPKSETMVYEKTMHNPWAKLHAAYSRLIVHVANYSGVAVEGPIVWTTSGRINYTPYVGKLRRDYQRALQQWRRWVKHCRLAGADTDEINVTRQIVAHKPAPRVEWRGEKNGTYESTFFIDSERRFLNRPYLRQAGYYKI